MNDVNTLLNNGIDVSKSLELFGDMQTYKETLGEFLDSIDKKIADIKKYKEASDMSNYAILVHSLKSDSKYLGFTTLAELSYKHELESKANNIGFVYDNYDELMKEAYRIIEVTSTYMGRTFKKLNLTPTVHSDKKILVVDDSNIIRIFIQKIFNDMYEVVMANDGEEALRIIEADTDNKIVGMLLDLNMPNVDGFTVLEYFEMNSLFVKLPVSIITGEADIEMINRAKAYPIVDVLYKPFNERDIKLVVEKTINSK